MSMTGRLRDVLHRGEPRVDADMLIARIDALGDSRERPDRTCRRIGYGRPRW
jgi:hypothetical protein